MPARNDGVGGNGADGEHEITDEGPALTIREVSARTGISEGTLRMWETRYSFPTPARLASGHRRYSQLQLAQVRAVVRAREQGLSLPGAIEHARTIAAGKRPSVFAALRSTFPYLRPQLMGKPALLALSEAIEDECQAQAAQALLIGCFQTERNYRDAEPRWREMARTAEQTIVLADFERTRRPRGGPAEVAIPPSDPLSREWVLVCESPGFGACLSAWERLGRRGERQFEMVWTVERSVVRFAARVCCELAAEHAPAVVEGLSERLAEPAPSSPPEVRSAVELLSRMVLYATRAASV
ncbi:MAG TPA: DICT sensory domain-containing protein [Solirubrobacteraceae bacterium]|nr:DICT sensory domain-containing protein [Solirubrobacteraceae bacterium]